MHVAVAEGLHHRHQHDEQSLAQRERIAQRRLDQQALALRAEQIVQAIVADGQVLEEVVNTLPEVADPAQWEQAVGQIDGRMRRLEPVNLAAIHECGEAEQRKSYLDSQNTDLTTALETLEEAIRKIDPAAHVVMLSGDAVKTNIVEASKGGAAGFLKKPFTQDRLIAMVKASDKEP